jgi:hypothetical protein
MLGPKQLLILTESRLGLESQLDPNTPSGIKHLTNAREQRRLRVAANHERLRRRHAADAGELSGVSAISQISIEKQSDFE